MKKITMITSQNCSYCRKAKTLLNRIYRIRPAYASGRIDIIDVKEADERKLDCDLLPGFYIGDQLVYEGYMTMDKMLELFEAAENDQIVPFSSVK